MGFTVGLRRAVGGGGAFDPEGEASPPPLRPQADPRSTGTDGHPLRLEDGHPLGGTLPGDGLRLGGHLLARPDEWQRQDVWQKLTKRCWQSSTQPIRSTAAGRGRLLPRACLRGRAHRPSPVDRRKPGSKHHLITCGAGNPLAAELSAGNVNDVTRFVPLVNAVLPIEGRRGRPRRRPREVYGDRAYHSRSTRHQLRERRVQARVRQARRSTWFRPGPQALGRGAHALLASPVPAPAGALRAAR